MSIISSEADRLYPSSAWPDHPNVLRQLYDSDDLREAYEQGATRQPTDKEIEAGAKALYDALNSVCFFSWESADRASRADYIDAMRLALKAIQGKSTEEMNLLGETKDAISRSGHSTDDVRFVGSRDGELGIPWSQAEPVLDIDYDDGYGSQEIAADLVVVFTDGGFLRREEYDGSERWKYEPPFRVPETQKPFKLVKALSYYPQLLVDINYPMGATEE